MASELMERMLGSASKTHPGLDIWQGFGKSETRHFSGDLVLHTRGGGSTYVLHADSMGHGLVAAIPLLPLADTFYALAHSGHTVPAIAIELNRVIYERMPRGRFVAASILRIDADHSMIEIWCGGMPPMMTFDHSGTRGEPCNVRHSALGVLAADAFDARTSLWHWEPGKRQRLFSYSDGLADAQDSAGHFFGEARMLDMFARHHVLASEHAPFGFLQPLLEHVDTQRDQDDMTLLVVDCDAFAPQPD